MPKMKDGLPCYSPKRILTAIHEDALEFLPWGTHAHMGKALLIAMPQEGHDLVLVCAGCTRAPRY